MKRCLILTFLLLLLTFGFASGARFVKVVGVNDFYASTTTGTTVEMWYWSDERVAGSQNGFFINVTGGSATANWLRDGHTISPTGASWGLWAVGYQPALPALPNFVNAGFLDISGTGGITTFNTLLHGIDFEAEWTYTGPDDENYPATICIVGDYVDNWVFTASDGVTNLDPGFNPASGQPDTTGVYNDFCFEVGYQECQAPAFTTTPPGDVLTAPHCNGGSFQFAADPVEEGKVITGYAVVDDGGLAGASITNGGLFSFGADDPGDYTVIVSVSNSCPATTEYTFTVSLSNSGLQYTSCPAGDKQVSQGKAFVWDLGLDNFDCDPITETASVIVNPGTSTPDISVADGVFTFNTTGDDIGIWSFEVCGIDPFMAEPVCCQFRVEVTATSTFGVRIAKIGEAPDFVFQGHYAYLPIYLDYMGTEDAIGGFDFLIAYDASALTFISAERGDAISCWEYFTYRFGPFGNCDGVCPSGMIQIIAMAEANNGPYHPTGCDGADGFFTTPAELVKIKFYVTDDRTFECQFVPVYWYWMECSDNAISDMTGNKLFVSNHVYNVNWVDINNPYYELVPPDGTIDENDHHYGTFDACIVPYENKPIPIRDIDFFNGGIDIACGDEIDKRGDLNLNNLPNEIADAVLYTNYFIYGPGVFVINIEGQIAASDVNNDGRVLTVGDLIYLIRILTGDAAPFDKLSPFASDATVRMSGNTVSIESGVNVGGALFVFDGEADVTLLADGMEMLSDVVDGQTRALVYGNFDNPASIEAGTSNVLQVNGDVTLTEVEVSDYFGNMVNADIVYSFVPKQYALGQNYPNPFNPTTEVAFDLPEAANYTLDVYNIAGQLVKSFSGYSDAGTVKVTIDANGWASGIYFYRLQANNFVDTKKMVLMK